MNSAFFACALISGCGGGGGDGGGSPTPPPPPPAPGAAGAAAGAYNGSIPTRISLTLVVEDGSYFVFYSRVGDTNLSFIDGFIAGNGTSSASSFSSSNGLDYFFSGGGSGVDTRPYTLSFNLPARPSMSGGTLSRSGGSIALAGTFDTNYDAAPSLATVAGTYSGKLDTFAGGSLLVGGVTVSASGAIAGNYTATCTFTGQLTPRTSGNVYAATFSFGNSCPAAVLSAVQGAAGSAYFDPVNKRLIVGASNAARTDGVLLYGTKP